MFKKITVIGGGPGGYTFAIRAAQMGAQVTLIEKNSLGGTCLNWGCIPTKSYIESLGQEHELAKVKQRKDKIVSQLRNGIENLIKKNKINFLKGEGKVISPREVEVFFPDGSTKKIKNDILVLATGSVPVHLSIPGIDSPSILDSQQLLNLEKKPENLTIVGGGVIGIEFAQIFAQLGSKVTVVEMLPQILGNFDEEMVRRLLPVLKKKGINILTSTKVTQFSYDQGKVLIHTSSNKETIIEADTVLISVGRKPNLSGIDISKLGLEMEGNFIKVNDRMETNLPQVYALGDLVSSPMLAHVASYEAEIAVKAVFQERAKADYKAVPYCVYTHPELAAVGLNEKEIKNKGIEYKVGKFPFTANGRAQTQENAYGMVKVIAEKNTGKILGASILGPQASELIHQLTLAVRWELTVDQMADTIHAHPTLSESVLEACHSVFGKAVHFG